MGGDFLGGIAPYDPNSNPDRFTVIQDNSFLPGQAIRYNGTIWVTAQADDKTHEAWGVVESATATSFLVVKQGTIKLNSLTPGAKYYLSPSLAGATTTTEPTTPGQLTQFLFSATSTTEAFVYVYDGKVIPTPPSTASGDTVKKQYAIGGGFSAGDVVGFDGVNWFKCKADTSANAEALGIIESVASGIASIVHLGNISIASASFTPGGVYWLSDGTAGLLTLTKPGTSGHIEKPMFIAISTTTGIVLQMRGSIISASTSRFDSFNNVINSAFDWWKKGTSFTIPAALDEVANKWQVDYDGTIGTFAISRQKFTEGQTDVEGDAGYYLKWNHSVAASGSSFHILRQRIGTVSVLAGQSVTISLWMKAASGSPVVATRLTQSFGTTGSPSADVNSNVGSHTLTTSWSKFSANVVLPSISGKTIGDDDNSDGLYLEILFPINTTFDIDISNVQVEMGGTASAFVRQQHTREGDGLYIVA